MRIKLVENETDLARCLDFFKRVNINVLPYSTLFYIEDNNEIVCSAGYHKDWGAMLEPMYSENSIRGIKAGKEMYEFMELYFKLLGHSIIRFRSKFEPLIDLMEKHYGFKKQDLETYLIKEV